jgi:putative ABC transport system substrate-binding protein
MTTLSRRHFMQGAGALGLGLLAGCGWRPGQEAPRVPRIGVLFAALSAASREADALRQGLRDAGYVDGRNILLEWRTADGQPSRLPELAAQLVNLPADVLVAGGAVAVRAAREATQTIPIVIPASPVADPVAEGFAASLARPGGNITGLSNLATPLAGKRLELLQQAIPTMSRLALLWDPHSYTDLLLSELQNAARALGVDLWVLEIHTADELGSAFETVSRASAQALFIPTSALVLAHRTRLTELIRTSLVPIMADQRDLVASGALMSYGASMAASYAHSATYIDKILRGAKPADLPIEQDTTLEFVINLKTAQALGLTIPQHVLLQATEVIQ